MQRPEGSDEMRCTCSRAPLLAVGGRDAAGKGFLHIMTWKGKRLYVNVVITDGTARIQCRECLRWWKVTIRYEKMESRQERLPESIHLGA